LNQFCLALALRHSVLVALCFGLDGLLGCRPVELLATMAATRVEFLLAQLLVMAIDQAPRRFTATLRQELRLDVHILDSVSRHHCSNQASLVPGR
jgi:hypothetical protein